MNEIIKRMCNDYTEILEKNISFKIRRSMNDLEQTLFIFKSKLNE